MKLFFIIIIICGFSLIGFMIWKNYSKKKVFYKNITDFCTHLAQEIRFNKNNIKKIISNCKQNYSSDLILTMNAYLNDCLVVSEILTKIESNEVEQFFKSLGKFDVDGELANISKHKEIFIRRLKESEQLEKTKGMAMFKIFIILGLLVGIILI